VSANGDCTKRAKHKRSETGLSPSLYLKSILRGRVLLVGIGHPLRGDDAFGPALVERLTNAVPKTCTVPSRPAALAWDSPRLELLLLDAGNAPENYLGKIVSLQPDAVIIADATDIASAPGEWVVLESDEILDTGHSTHDLSLRRLIEYLSGQTPTRFFLLAVQPASVALGSPLSQPVAETLATLAELITTAVRDTHT